MDITFLKERIASTKLQIVAYEDAALALAGGVQSYTIDTAQTRQTVTKLDISSIQQTIESLYNRCAVLEVRLNGGGSTIGRPGF